MSVRLQSEKRGTWKIKVSAGTDTVTGKRRYVIETFQASAPTLAAQKKQAEARERQLRVEVDRGRHKGTSQTVADLLDEWFPQAQLAANTRRDYGSAIRVYLKPRLGGMQLTKLTAWDLDRLYNQLLREGLGASRIKKVHNVISSALGQAVRWRWITENPALHASPPPVSQPDIVVLDPVQVGRLLDHLAVEAPWFWSFITLAANLGTRPAEVCALRWGDLDLAASEVTIKRAWDPDGVKETKTGKGRTVSLSPRTLQAVREHRTREAEQLLALGIPLQPDHYLFHRDHDPTVPLRRDQAGKVFARLRDRLGLDDKYVLKNFRHYVATQMLGAGVDVRTVAGRLGHSRPATTLDRYAQFLPAKDREAAELLDRLLEGES